jgi:hypothetical protein
VKEHVETIFINESQKKKNRNRPQGFQILKLIHRVVLLKFFFRMNQVILILKTITKIKNLMGLFNTEEMWLRKDLVNWVLNRNYSEESTEAKRKQMRKVEATVDTVRLSNTLVVGVPESVGLDNAGRDKRAGGFLQ